MTHSEYTDYLKSEHWRTIRRLVKERDGYACVICNSTEHLEVHHRTYDRVPYCERLSDLCTLCSKCHGLFTVAAKKAKKPKAKRV